MEIALFLGKQTVDPIVKAVADFVFLHSDVPHLEIEAKFGRILEDTGVAGQEQWQRMYLPVQTECVLDESLFRVRRLRFESDLGRHQHHNFNEMLNKRVEQCAEKSFTGPKISYKHTKELDEFFKVTDESSRVKRLRITRDMRNDGKILRSVYKRNVADLHIYFPQCPVDCRLSINTEEPAKIPDDLHSIVNKREKDRISYSMSGMQLDLTQVKSEEKLLHELELELSDVSGLLDEKSKLAAGVKNDYIWQISKLVSNIKGISSKTASIQQHLQQEQQQRSTTNSQKRQRTDD